MDGPARKQPSGQASEDDFVELWRLESESARALAAEAERFEDLQTVLRCCERILPELSLAEVGSPESALLVEALWTVALASYARCFSADADGTPLTEDDAAATHPDNDAEVREWHRALLRLHRLYASSSANPREAFLVSVARGADGAPAGIALTSAVQPPLDEVTVRSAGTLAFALSSVVDDRIASRQGALFAELGELPTTALDALERWRTARPSPA